MKNELLKLKEIIDISLIYWAVKYDLLDFKDIVIEKFICDELIGSSKSSDDFWVALELSRSKEEFLSIIMMEKKFKIRLQKNETKIMYILILLELNKLYELECEDKELLGDRIYDLYTDILYWECKCNLDCWAYFTPMITTLYPLSRYMDNFEKYINYLNCGIRKNLINGEINYCELDINFFGNLDNIGMRLPESERGKVILIKESDYI